MDKPTCKIDWCTRQSRTKGYCVAHYKRFLKGADMNAPIRGELAKCRVPSCHNDNYAKGYCNAHYLRKRKGAPMEAAIRKRRVGRICEVPGCRRKHMGHGYCSTHYKSFMRARFWNHILQERGYRCAQCRKKHHQAVFDLHHRDPSQKRYAIGSVIGNISWDELLAEAAKCDLLCANCHRIVHFDADQRHLFP